MIRRRTLVGAAGASLLAAPCFWTRDLSQQAAEGDRALSAGRRNRWARPHHLRVPLPEARPADRGPECRRRLGHRRFRTGAAGRSRRLYVAVQREPVRAGQDGGADLSLRSADRLPRDRPGGRSAAGADPEQQRARHRLCQHHRGHRQGAEEVFLRPVLGRLGRTHRHARFPEAHRPAARHHPLQGHGARQRRPDGGQRPALHGSMDGDCCRSPPPAGRVACSSPPRSARSLRPTSRPPTKSA